MADKAILVGINDYESIGDLQGCSNDVDNIKDLLVNSFQFDPGNITTLRDEEVLYDHLVDRFNWLFEDTVSSDRLVFHFSGHGSFIDSTDDDEAVDELLCLYDMDWDNEDSYLVDDDLGILLEELNPGVHMTVILDACHSGTGTKAITRDGKTVKNPTKKSRLLIVEDAANTIRSGLRANFKSRSAKVGAVLYDASEVNPPLARFVPPPASVRRKAEKARFKRVGEKLRSGPWNHQLLAGADAQQTAADAFIDNKYQGAFTFHLCQTSRALGTGKPVQKLVSEVKSSLQAAGYQQTPQLEGVGQEDKLFGGSATERVESPTAADSGAWSADEAPQFEAIQEAGSDLSRLSVFSQLVRVQEKFLDLGNQFLATESAGRAAGEFPDAASGGNERIVFVHGISQHRAGYSEPWYAALRPHLSRSIPKVEVIWSDLVNPRNLAGLPALSAEANELRQAIQKELKQREELLLGPRSPGSSPQDRSFFRESGFAIDDFIRYMTSEETRNQILQRFNRVVIPLLRSGETLHVISHSWGTVVAFEALRLMDRSSYAGRVRNLFTVGSALSISAVQWNLFDRVSDGRRPRHVDNVINLDAGGDIVGGEISGTFTTTDEFLGLVPTGCARIPFTNTAVNISCAHSSYFDSNNVATNRDIFARWING